MRDRIEAVFTSAPFVRDLGIEFLGCGPGWCEARLELLGRHEQQAGFAHAGVQTTLADHTAGAAAMTMVGEDRDVLSVEFKVNMLRRAVGHALRCRAEVLRTGQTLTVVEAWVYATDGEEEKMTLKMTATMITPAKA